MLRYCIFILLSCFFVTTANAQVATFDTLPEESLLLLNVVSEDLLLAEGLEAYSTKEGILVPLSGISQVFGLPITSRADLGTAEGWYFKENQKFSLDYPNKKVTLAGVTQPFDGVLRMENDFYVPIKLFYEWFGITIEPNLLTQELRIKSKNPLPAIVTAQREKNIALARGSKFTAPKYPRYDADAALPDFTMPYSNVTAGSNYDTRNSPEFTSTASAITTMKALDFNVENYTSVSGDDGVNDFRLSLSQSDPDGGLLGPLSAKQLVLGDTYTSSLSSVAESASGAGVKISNFPLNRINNFSRTTLRGNLQPNWDVELYRNDSLLLTTRSNAKGEYEFVDVPLLTGTNVIRLVFYGPFGEVREETKQFIVGADLIKQGAFQYELVATKQDEDLVPINETDDTGQGKFRAVGDIAYGLTDNIALLGQSATLTLDDDNRHDYISTGFGTAIGGVFWRSLYINDISSNNESDNNSVLTSGSTDGGYAFDNRIQTLIYDTNVVGEWQEFQDNFVSEDTESIATPLDRKLHIALDRYIAMPDTYPSLNLGLDGEQKDFINNSKNVEITQRTSTYLGRSSITNEIKYINNEESTTDNNFTFLIPNPIDTTNNDNEVTSPPSEQWEGTLRTSTIFGTTDVRADLLYDIHPDFNITGINLTGNYHLSDVLSLQPSAVYITGFDDQDKQSELGLSVIRDFETFQWNISAAYNDQGEYRAGTNVTFAVGQNPANNNQFEMFRNQIANTGILDTVAFVDRNGDGIQDENEEALPNVAFQVDQNVSEDKTNNNGHAMIAQLPVGEPIGVAVDGASLEDPAFKPVNAGKEVVLRPGVPVRLEFPIAPTGSTEGTVYLKSTSGNIRPASNVTVDIVRDGKIVKSVKTAFDGYYIFEFVTPGVYTVQINPDQAQRLNLSVSESPKNVIIKDETSLISGIDWVVSRVTKTDNR